MGVGGIASYVHLLSTPTPLLPNFPNEQNSDMKDYCLFLNTWPWRGNISLQDKFSNNQLQLRMMKQSIFLWSILEHYFEIDAGLYSLS